MGSTLLFLKVDMMTIVCVLATSSMRIERSAYQFLDG